MKRYFEESSRGTFGQGKGGQMGEESSKVTVRQTDGSVTECTGAMEVRFEKSREE